jgi:rRNA-processing protein FCF1
MEFFINKSITEILQSENYGDGKKAIVVDTSVLIKRPKIADELIGRFDEVIISDTVVSEVNYIKDGNSKNKQNAWLVMVTLKKHIDDNAIKYCLSRKTQGKNDERIVAVAAERARLSRNDTVYVFTDDVDFSYLIKEQGLSNIKLLTFAAYDEQFRAETSFDQRRTQVFFDLVKNRRFAEVEKYNLSGVGISEVNTETGFTPLIQAIRNRDFKMTELLIERGVDLNVRDKFKYCFTPLLHTAQLKEPGFSLFKKLGESGADMDIGSSGKNFGNTPLMVCAWGGFKNGTDYLTSQGACTNQQDNNGFTALIKACIRGQYNIALSLVDITDTRIRSRDNKKADEYIIDESNPLAVKLLQCIVEKRQREVNG